MFIDRLPNGGGRLVISHGPQPGVWDYDDLQKAIDEANQYEAAYGRAPESAGSVIDPSAQTGIPEEPSALARWDRNVGELGRGIVQKSLMAADWFGRGQGRQQTRAVDYTQKHLPDHKAYQRGMEEVPGIDWAGMLGAAQPALLMAPIAAKGLLAGTLTNAGVGAGIGSAMFTPGEEPQGEVTPDQLLAETGINTGIGAATGAAAPLILKGLANSAAWVLNTGASLGSRYLARIKMFSKKQHDAVAEGVQKALSRHKIAWGDLDTEAQKALYDNAAQQAAGGGKVDPTVLARQARLARYKPTTGQVTRDSGQWTMEQDLARTGMPEGAPLRGRFNAQTAQLVEDATRLQRRTGGLPSAAEGAARYGESVEELSEALGKKISAAYDKAAEEGVEFGMTPDNLLTTLDDLRDDIGIQNVTESIWNRLKRWPTNSPLVDADGNLIRTARTTRAADLRQAEELRKFIGKLGKDPQERGARVRLLKALDADIDAAINRAGDPMPSNVYGPARAAASNRFEGMKMKVYGDMLGVDFKDPKIAEEDFFTKGWLRSSAKQVEKAVTWLRKQNSEHSDAMLIEARAAAIRYINEAAGANPSPGLEPQFSGAAANKALKNLGMKKLRALFFDQPETVTNIHMLVANARELQTAPPYSNINYSGSGNFLLRFLRKLRPELVTQLDADARLRDAAAAVSGANYVDPAALIPPGAAGDAADLFPSRALGPYIYEEVKRR